MAQTTGAKRQDRVKVNVTAVEKTELVRRAEAAGQSLSDYLRHVGLGRRVGAAPEQVLQITALLAQVLEMLERLAILLRGLRHADWLVSPSSVRRSPSACGLSS